MNRELALMVRNRAGNCCEYCLFPAAYSCRPFTVDHIRARQHGGKTHFENLALACSNCNLHKGPNLSGIDPTTGELVRLFNPRLDVWDDHFQLEEGVCVGKTPEGRATVAVLALNEATILAARRALIKEGVFRPGAD